MGKIGSGFEYWDNRIAPVAENVLSTPFARYLPPHYRFVRGYKRLIRVDKKNDGCEVVDVGIHPGDDKYTVNLKKRENGLEFSTLALQHFEGARQIAEQLRESFGATVDLCGSVNQALVELHGRLIAGLSDSNFPVIGPSGLLYRFATTVNGEEVLVGQHLLTPPVLEIVNAVTDLIYASCPALMMKKPASDPLWEVKSFPSYADPRPFPPKM